MGCITVTLFLPEFWSDGDRLLDATNKANTYRVAWDVSYLRSTDEKDRDPVMEVEEGDIVEGEMGKGWLKVQYCPITWRKLGCFALKSCVYVCSQNVGAMPGRRASQIADLARSPPLRTTPLAFSCATS